MEQPTARDRLGEAEVEEKPRELLGPHCPSVLQSGDIPHYLQYHGLSSLDRAEAQAVAGAEVVPSRRNGDEDRTPPL